jgi:ribosomal protein L11 methyltransferase
MKLAPLSYFELEALPSNPKIPFTGEMRGRLGDFFSSCGIPRSEVVFTEGPQKSSAVVYTRSFHRRRRIKKNFKKIFPRGIRLKERLLVQEDWFDKWQEDYEIMPLGRKFVLVPEWKRKAYRPGKRIPIFLDPQGVSGSGQHPTTQLMADLLERIAGKFEDCLDLGTGTGILGIMAAKLGAQSVLGVDNDRRAVKAARINFKLNHLPHAISAFQDVTRTKATKKYDLVCANLISPVLEKIRGDLFSRVQKGGYLAVSGIHVQNFSDFRKRFRHARLRCLKTLQRRGWTALLLKRF